MNLKEYDKQKEVKKQRRDVVTIGKATYEIIAEEKDGVKDTPLTILQRLIDRQVSEAIQGRTCCLETNGGKQDVRTSST